MANVYWHGDGGNWSDHATHWFNATNGGGGGHGAAPGIDDNAIFDANSFDNPAQTVTVDAIANCLNMDWTGATNTPTLTVNNNLRISGNFTPIAAMVTNGTSYISITSDCTFTTNNHSFTVRVSLQETTGKTTTLVGNFTSNTLVYVQGGILNSGGYSITCTTFTDKANTVARTLNLGSSVITCTGWDFKAAALTLTNATHTINISGTGSFANASVTGSFGTVNLNGTAHTISGSNTFQKLTLKADTTQTTTFTDGTTQTILLPVFTGSSGKIKTLKGSGALGWALTKTGTPLVNCDYMDITGGTANPDLCWYAGPTTHSIDGTGNTRWYFTSPLLGLSTSGGTLYSIQSGGTKGVAGALNNATVSGGTIVSNA